MTVLASFDVIGLPRAQGSKRAFVAKNGRAQMTEMAGAAGAQWRDAVALAARREADRIVDSGVGSELVPPFDGALTLDVIFRFPMPASRSKAQRALGSIPKTSAPDTSKLVRSLEDGLQAAGLIVDDARFWQVWGCKVEVADGWTGARMTVRRQEKAIAS